MSCTQSGRQTDNVLNDLIKMVDDNPFSLTLVSMPSDETAASMAAIVCEVLTEEPSRRIIPDPRPYSDDPKERAQMLRKCYEIIVQGRRIFQRNSAD